MSPVPRGNGYIFNISFKFFCVIQNLIPDMWQIVFAYVPIHGMAHWLFMKVTSLINLARVCSSLLKCWNCPHLWYDLWFYSGHRWIKGNFRCSWNLFPTVLKDSSMYSSLHFSLPHLYLYITPLFWKMESFSFEVTSKSLMVLPPLKCICIPCLLQMFLQLSLFVRHHYMSLLVLWWVVPGVVGIVSGPADFSFV